MEGVPANAVTPLWLPSVGIHYTLQAVADHYVGLCLSLSSGLPCELCQTCIEIYVEFSWNELCLWRLGHARLAPFSLAVATVRTDVIQTALMCIDKGCRTLQKHLPEKLLEMMSEDKS